jgi:hypothetical protein
MKKTSFAAAIGSVFMFATAAGAQTYTTWTPGVELRGHSVNVETNGVTNTVTFENDGSARILSASGQETRGQWFAQNNQLCLQTSTARECWPYQQAFQAGQPMTLTSDCASTSRWTPISAGQQAMPTSGERG